jgi:hypothetical protein
MPASPAGQGMRPIVKRIEQHQACLSKRGGNPPDWADKGWFELKLHAVTPTHGLPVNHGQALDPPDPAVSDRWKRERLHRRTCSDGVPPQGPNGYFLIVDMTQIGFIID